MLPPLPVRVTTSARTDVGGTCRNFYKTCFGDEDGYWQLGVRIELMPPSHLQQHSVFAVFWVSKSEGKPMVKVSPAGKPRPLDLDDAKQCEDFYDGLVDGIKECFDGKPSAATIGFVVSS